MNVILNSCISEMAWAIRKRLMGEGYGSPTVWTTSPLRKGELDDKVFISKSLFSRKTMNGDFLYTTNDLGVHVGYSRFIDSSKDNIIVVPHSGIEMYKSFFLKRNEEYSTILMDMDLDKVYKYLDITLRKTSKEVDSIMREVRNINRSSYDLVVNGGEEGVIKLINNL